MIRIEMLLMSDIRPPENQLMLRKQMLIIQSWLIGMRENSILMMEKSGKLIAMPDDHTCNDDLSSQYYMIFLLAIQESTY
jgi:hypothetical protein